MTSTPATVETASWARRVGALLVDWLACYAIISLAVASGLLASNPAGIWTLVLFVLETAVFTATLGGSFGKLATRLRVVRADGSARPVSLLAALLRSVLVALLVPPLVFKADGRGLHDLAVGTATVPLAPRR